MFRATLIGVNSWAIFGTSPSGCDVWLYPTVAARVTKVLDWIKENTDGACTSKGKRLEDYNFKSGTGRKKRSQLLDHDETNYEMIGEEELKDYEKYSKYEEVDDEKYDKNKASIRYRGNDYEEEDEKSDEDENNDVERKGRRGNTPSLARPHLKDAVHTEHLASFKQVSSEGSKVLASLLQVSASP